jgi:hypothetical protein
MEQETLFLARYISGRVRIPRGPRTKGIRPHGTKGSIDYEWSEGEKRAWLEITHVGEQLPSKALAESFNPFSSVYLWPHVDLRLIGPNIQVNAAEIITICVHRPPNNFLERDS